MIELQENNYPYTIYSIDTNGSQSSITFPMGTAGIDYLNILDHTNQLNGRPVRIDFIGLQFPVTIKARQTLFPETIELEVKSPNYYSTFYAVSSNTEKALYSPKKHSTSCECGAEKVGHSSHSTWCPKT